jgi:hypothetical protein
MEVDSNLIPAPYPAPAAAPPGEPPPARGATGFRGRIGAALAAIVALLAKFKTVLLVLPKLKLFTSAGTMLVSLAAYSFVFGWPFAAGFIA